MRVSGLIVNTKDKEFVLLLLPCAAFVDRSLQEKVYCRRQGFGKGAFAKISTRAFDWEGDAVTDALELEDEERVKARDAEVGQLRRSLWG